MVGFDDRTVPGRTHSEWRCGCGRIEIESALRERVIFEVRRVDDDPNGT